MIAHLRGHVLSKSPNALILDCNGVGYELTISVATYTELPALDKPVALHVHTHVREDALQLFGFAHPTEKRLFEKLLTISGIGPRLAITVLSGIAMHRLIAAIRAADHATLTRIPGIGKKTAERVVLELKDKLEDLAAQTPTAAGPATPGQPPLTAIAEDVLSALTNLGYPRANALKAIETATKTSKDSTVTLDFEQLFRAAIAAIK